MYFYPFADKIIHRHTDIQEKITPLAPRPRATPRATLTPEGAEEAASRPSKSDGWGVSNVGTDAIHDTGCATRILLFISALALFRVAKYTTLKSAKRLLFSNLQVTQMYRSPRSVRSAISAKITSQGPRRLERQDRTHYHSTIVYGRK